MINYTYALQNMGVRYNKHKCCQKYNFDSFDK